MEWFNNNWPILLVGLGIYIVFSGITRRLAKLAFLGVVVGVLGLIIWPQVNSAL